MLQNRLSVKYFEQFCPKYSKIAMNVHIQCSFKCIRRFQKSLLRNLQLTIGVALVTKHRFASLEIEEWTRKINDGYATVLALGPPFSFTRSIFDHMLTPKTKRQEYGLYGSSGRSNP